MFRKPSKINISSTFKGLLHPKIIIFSLIICFTQHIFNCIIKANKAFMGLKELVIKGIVPPKMKI